MKRLQTAFCFLFLLMSLFALSSVALADSSLDVGISFYCSGCKASRPCRVTVVGDCVTPDNYTVTKVCSVCSYIETRTWKAYGYHPIDTWARVNSPATCTDYGYQERYCSDCYTFLSSSVLSDNPPLGHDFQETSREAPTCTVSGSIVKTCSRCEASETETLPALGHDWAEINRIPATEKAPGSVEYECSVCGETKTEVLSVIVTPPDTPSTPTMTGLLTTIGSVFSVSMSWVSAVANTIAANPILLLCVVIGFLGTGAALFKRLLGAGH